jgi:hypothetical protein
MNVKDASGLSRRDPNVSLALHEVDIDGPRCGMVQGMVEANANLFFRNAVVLLNEVVLRNAVHNRIQSLPNSVPIVGSAFAALDKYI